MTMKFTIVVPPGAGAAIAKLLVPRAEKATKMALPKVAALVVQAIGDAADSSLKTTAQQYKWGLAQPGAVELTDDMLKIKLMTPIARALELGAESYDLKAKLMIKAKRFTKDGSPYIDIPFQHAITQGAINMPSMPPEIASAMTAAVAKSRSVAIKAGVPPAEAGLGTVRLNNKSPGKSFDRILHIGGKTFATEVNHKRGIHDDMIRTASKVGKSTSTKYSTIRRISGKSDPSSWWHPGFPGKHLFPKTIPLLRTQIEMIIRDAYAEVGLKVKFK